MKGTSDYSPRSIAHQDGIQEPKKPLLVNPHGKKTGVIFDQTVLDWWKDQYQTLIDYIITLDWAQK